MFVPGIISLAFYKRRPSRVQVILGLVATIVLSALLGYISPSGSLGQVGSVILAVGGGGVLYVVIFGGLPFLDPPRDAQPRAQTTATPSALGGDSEKNFFLSPLCLVAQKCIS